MDNMDNTANLTTFKSLSRAEASALRATQPSVSPWRVVLAQLVVGLVAAALAAWIFGASPEGVVAGVSAGFGVMAGADGVVGAGAVVGTGIGEGTIGPVGAGNGIGWSVLYGAAVVVLPGALMARGMTSRLSRTSPAASAVSFLAWQTLKVGTSVAMLVLAPQFVQPLVWPALLAGLVLCIKVYWVALLWRGT